MHDALPTNRRAPRFAAGEIAVESFPSCTKVSKGDSRLTSLVSYAAIALPKLTSTCVTMCPTVSLAVVSVCPATQSYASPDGSAGLAGVRVSHPARRPGRPCSGNSGQHAPVFSTHPSGQTPSASRLHSPAASVGSAVMSAAVTSIAATWARVLASTGNGV
jgi:hypothetical protein